MNIYRGLASFLVAGLLVGFAAPACVCLAPGGAASAGFCGAARAFPNAAVRAACCCTASCAMVSADPVPVMAPYGVAAAAPPTVAITPSPAGLFAAVVRNQSPAFALHRDTAPAPSPAESLQPLRR